MLAGLASFAPGLLGGLFGDPQKDLQKKIMKLLDPKMQAQLTQQMYQQALASPAFSQAQGAIAQGANATQGNIASELGARGIGTSGTGAILSSLTPSIVGSQQAGLKTAAYGSAQNQAMQNIQQRIAALQGTSGPSQSRQMFAGGLEAFLPFLMSRMGQMGGMGGGMAPSMGQQGFQYPNLGR